MTLYTDVHGPRQVAELAESAPTLPPGTDERISGYGVMGMAFESGDYLALRCNTAASFGPAYRAVWHRNPEGEWRVYSTSPPDLSCERYIGAACSYPSVRRSIDVDWLDDVTLRVRIADTLDWTVALRATPVTRMMSVMGTAMPHSMWLNEAVLAAMSGMAGPMMGVGRVRLTGRMPNGQTFIAAPQQIWSVAESRAVLGGRDFGPARPLPTQTRLGDFWLPQRGIFVRGFGHYERFDAASHVSAVERQQELLARVA